MDNSERRLDPQLRAVVIEGKHIRARRGNDQARAYLLSYSVPMPVIARVFEEMRREEASAYHILRR